VKVCSTLLTRFCDTLQDIEGFEPHPLLATLDFTVDGPTLSDHQKIIASLKANGCKGVEIRGELRVGDLIQLMQMINDVDLKFGVVSPGYELTRETMEVILARALYLEVDIGTALPDVYVKANEPADTRNFIHIMENLRYLANARNTQMSECRLGLGFSVNSKMKGKAHYTAGLIMGNQVEVDYITFMMQLLGESAIEEEQAAKELIDMQKLAHHSFVEVLSNAAFKPMLHCKFAKIHVAIDHKGNVFMCPNFLGRKAKHRLGNMLKKDIGQLVGSPEHHDKFKAISQDICAAYRCWGRLSD
jgi:radical SAM protein with 4Fe4S-binding SPASM domain